jgi:hypothetical protein
MGVAVFGICIFLISAAGAAYLAGRNAGGRQRQTKVLLFALYFWLLAFVQLITAAIIYPVAGL